MKRHRHLIHLIFGFGLVLLMAVAGFAEDDGLSKYNFIPGEKTVAFEDFSNTPNGDVPVGAVKVNGEAEVVAVNGEKWLKLGSGAEISIEVPKAEDLTIEFYLKEEGVEDYSFRMFLDNEAKEYSGFLDAGRLGIHYEAAYGSKDLPSNGVEKTFYTEGQGPVQYALTLQKERARLYINKVLAMNAVGFSPVMPNLITIRFGEGTMFLVKDITVATVIPDIAGEILNKGKYVSHGIRFDVGSAQVKEESYSVLKQVAEVLKNNPDLKIVIVGHTDSTGKADANKKLSQARAESVKQYLSAKFGIDGERLATRGAGDGEPLGDNKTLVGRALNRRVEFVKAN